MPEKTIRAPQYVVPDDNESSTYRFIIIAAKRARQLQNGARSYLPSTVKKPTVAAMEEVRRGLVSWSDPGSEPPAAPSEEIL
jgi:DNA-directed RNA polymerase subunit omega